MTPRDDIAAAVARRQFHGYDDQDPPDDFILSMRLPTSAATPSAEQAPAPSASPSLGAGAAPLQCSIVFCDDPATHGDMCERHAEIVKDIRKEWEELSAEFEDGWT